jgi:hypothetical protein
VCGGVGTANQCGCRPRSCVQAGTSCGPADDGCGGAVDCGDCPDGQTCGGGGTLGQCGCSASCAGKLCGESDGCAGTCESGSGCCTPACAGKLCGEPNGCGGTCKSGSGCCAPSCNNKDCGASDGCGGTCAGPCPGWEQCSNKQCICPFPLSNGICLPSCGMLLATQGVPNGSCCAIGCQPGTLVGGPGATYDCNYCCAGVATCQ